MASSTGISNIGYASNLDVESIISKMVALETNRKVPLQKAASLTTSRISTVSQLKSLMSTLQDKLTVLADASKWTSAMKANNSNATALSATVSTSATDPQAMGGTYNIKVDKLATAQNITSGRFATGYTFATGDLTITSDDPSKTPITVNIADGASLASVASSINQAGAGVTASILNDGTGERLVLASTATGEKNGFTLSGTGGMAALAYDGSAGSAILGSGATGGNVIAAQDAKATINGVEVSSTSNVFASTIQGVSFTALATGESTLTIASDTDALKTRITEFVTAYNAVNSLLSTSVKYDQDTDVAGVF
ncbi:MAG: flagellar filament capping protein FliD, partial [Comamonas sp.]